MDETTKDFIKIAKEAMSKAYYREVNVTSSFESETALTVGKVLQMVGDLLRS